MSTNSDSQPSRTVSNAWWLLLLQGISAVVLGFLLITQPRSTTEVIVAFIGVYWLVTGIFSIVRIFNAATRAHWGWSLAGGIIGIVAGILVLKHPLSSAVLLPETLIVIIAIEGIFIGIFEIARAMQGDGLSAYVLGILNILIGFFLWLNPFAAALSLPILMGVFGFVGGIILIVHAFQVRNLGK